MDSIHVRTPEDLKKDVKKILDKLGLDFSTAINLYLRQIVITESIPFSLRTANGFTPEQEREILRDEAEALKTGKRYRSVDAMFRDMLDAWPLPRKTKARKPRTR